MSIPPILLENPYSNPMTIAKAVDIIDLGDIIALYAGDKFRVFHNQKNLGEENLSEKMVVYIDCNLRKDLLEKDGWEMFLRNAFEEDFQELSGENPLKDRVIEHEVSKELFFNI